MEENKEKKEIKISLWTFYVLIAAMVLLIGAVVMGWLKVEEKSNTPQTMTQNEQQQNTQVAGNKNEELNVDSELVQKLYSYIRFKYFMPGGEFSIRDVNGNHKEASYPVILMYREKTSINNLDEDLKLLSACSALFDEKEYTVRKEKNKEDLADENIYVFSIDSIQNKSRTMYNSTINISKNSFSWTDSDAIEYNPQTNSYEYVQYISGGGTSYFDEFKLIKAEKNNNEVYVYDNYIRGIYDNDLCKLYATSDQNIKIGEIRDYDYEENKNIDKVKNSGITLPIYKHTFKQRNDGTYYWVSTELTNVSELETID